MKKKNNKSFFMLQFGDTPQIRAIDFLISFQIFDYPITAIAKGSNISYNSIVKFFNDWIKREIVIKTRKVGKSDYYKLNTKNPFIKNLIKLDWILTKEGIKS